MARPQPTVADRPPPALVEKPVSLSALSIEELIRHRVSLMLDRLGGDSVAHLHELVMREAERGLLTLILERCRGNQVAAAKALGLHRNSLRQKISRLGLLPAAPPRRKPVARRRRQS